MYGSTAVNRQAPGSKYAGKGASDTLQPPVYSANYHHSTTCVMRDGRWRTDWDIGRIANNVNKGRGAEQSGSGQTAHAASGGGMQAA
jgi:hypothetical protein